MNKLDHPLFKSLAKISPDLVDGLIAQGVRKFTNIKVVGDMPTDIWAISSTGKNDTSSSFQTLVTRGNSVYNSTLVQTPNIRLMPRGKGHILTNARIAIAQNPYAYRPFGLESEINLTTANDVLHCINWFTDATLSSKVSNVVKATVNDSIHDSVSSVCAMFGLEYMRDMPLLVQATVGSDTAPVFTHQLLKEGNKFPDGIVSLGVPGVKYFLICVPNAQQTSTLMFGQNEGAISAAELAWLRRYQTVDATALNKLRSALGTVAPPANSTTAYAVGSKEYFWIGVPVLSDEQAWTRVWLADCTARAGSSPDRNQLGRVWHIGYNDSRYDNVIEGLYTPPKSASATVAMGVLPKNIDGSVVTIAQLNATYAGEASGQCSYYKPLIGPLGEVEFIMDLDELTFTSEQIVFDDDPDRVFEFQTLITPYKRLGVKFTRLWYEHYYTTGFGIYAPRTSNVQKNTLDSWTVDDINSLGVVSYAEPLAVNGSLIDQLQIRQKYKTTKEKACETDDWDKQYCAEGVTWGQARQILDAANERATFYAPVFGSLSVGNDVQTPITSASFSRTGNDGPLTVKIVRESSIEESEMTADDARVLYVQLVTEDVTPTLTNWTVTLTQEETQEIANAKKETARLRQYGNYNRKFIGLNMLYTYQFPWESLSKAGYPCVVEMPRQSAIMAIVQSVVYYERFGKQLNILWQKLSATSMLNKIK